MKRHVTKGIRLAIFGIVLAGTAIWLLLMNMQYAGFGS